MELSNTSEIKIGHYKRMFFVFNHPRLIKILLIISIIIFAFFSYTRYKKSESLASNDYIHQPKIDDLYFLDFRLMSDKLRPKEKYRLAQIVDITGDIVSLVYSDFLYFRSREIEEAIGYGHLRFSSYFEGKRYNFSIKELISMRDASAIFRIKRPIHNQLYGNYVSPITPQISGKIFFPGKSENTKAKAFLHAINDETKYESAFFYFTQSAQYGYAEGQVNLAEMYLTDVMQEKDLNKALYWLKQASLQSYKPGITKYVIVCEQIPNCKVTDFYDELIASGVNLKVRAHKFSLSVN